jgi:hypothetical protein
VHRLDRGDTEVVDLGRVEPEGPGDQREGTRALHREDGPRGRGVDHLDVRGGARGEAGDHVGGVRGVGNGHPPVLGEAVDDEVVDDAPVLVAAERVLALAVAEDRGVVGEGRRGGLGRAPPPDPDRTEVGHVEDPDVGAHSLVLGERGSELERHLPARERRHPGAGGAVEVAERRRLEVGGVGHGRSCSSRWGVV